MDFLNTAYGQVLELLRSMTPAARITTAALLGVLVVSLVFLFQHQTESPEHFLFGAPLSHREVSALEVAFAQANLNSWQTEGNRILVPASERASYLAAAAEFNALPDSAAIIWNDVFEDTSPLDSRRLQQVREKQAKQRELANMIRQNAQIEEAYVSIEEQETSGFPRRSERRALAAIRASGNRSLDAALVRTVRYSVAAGGGLDSENVTVVDLNTSISYPGHGKDGAPLLEENIYHQNQRHFEEFYKRKIEDRLSMIQGAKIQVYVELEKELKNQTSTRQYEQGVQVRTKEYKKDTAAANPASGGRPGAVPNGVLGNQPQTIAAATSENTLTEERNETQQLPAATQTYTETAPLVPKIVKATIAVPTSYFEKVWRQENPSPNGAEPAEPDSTALSEIEQNEITKIEDAVKTMLPEPPPGDDPFPRVYVTTYTETPSPSLETAGVAAQAGTWLGSNWQTLAMFILAIVGVMMLRSMIRSAEAAALARRSDPGLPAAQLAELDLQQEEDEVEEVTNSLKARFQTSDRNLRDELTELVREDPDAAANVLQNWIGEAA